MIRVTSLWLIVSALTASSHTGEAPLTLKLGDGANPLRLRLDVVIDGRSPLENWSRFLDALFDHFDRDADALLSSAEAKSMFPLPLTKGKHLIIDFAVLDADRSRAATRDEFRAYCVENGFAAIIVHFVPASAEDARFSAWWQRCLDVPVGGKFTGDEWRRLPAAVRQYDLNDDEMLDIAEIRAAAEKLAAAKVTDGISAKDYPLLRVDLGGNSASLQSGALVRLLQPSSNAAYRLHDAADTWSLNFRPALSMPDFASTQEFLLAQFDTAAAGRGALPKTEIDEDAALIGLATLLGYADRNADKNLSRVELTNYLDLIKRGMLAQVHIKAADHAHNPIRHLDANGDGRLTLHELTAIKELAKPGLASLPRQFELEFSGPAGAVWGGVQLAARESRAASVQPPAATGPRWFQALDRNRDGYLSPREFLGPPVQFQRLDANSDGLISVQEAE